MIWILTDSPVTDKKTHKKTPITDKKTTAKSKDQEEKKVRGKVTPYKAKDLVSLVRSAITKNPSLSNKDMVSVLSPYGKTGSNIFTNSLLQNTCMLPRKEIFGDPATNATYALALKCELEKHDHLVHISMLDRKQTLKTYTL
jgi:hypothetical protein